MHNAACDLRLKHFSNKKGINGIKSDNKIKADDSNRVFAVKSKGRVDKMSPTDRENAVGIRKGRGRNSVEFDASSSEVSTTVRPNGISEHTIKGDVDLTNRNPKFD